jgi:hypothetical protein
MPAHERLAKLRRTLVSEWESRLYNWIFSKWRGRLVELRGSEAKSYLMPGATGTSKEEGTNYQSGKSSCWEEFSPSG